MNKAIGTALLAALVAAALFAISGARTVAGTDQPIRIAGCINGACS